MPPAEFEPAIPASVRPPTYALDRAAATGIGGNIMFRVINPLNPELNPICYLLALLGTHHFSTLAG